MATGEIQAGNLGGAPPQDPSPHPPSPDDPDDERKEKLDLYKLEYQKCADRYDNIYRAVWTNFSYVVAVAGVFLAFGQSRLPYPQLGWLVAIVLLLFWYFASYLPLNDYGDDVAKRLSELEKLVNVLAFNAQPDPEQRVGLSHFTDFAVKRKDKLERLHKRLWKEVSNLILWRLRVRFFVSWLALFLLVALICSCVSLAISFFGDHKSHPPAELKLEIRGGDGEDVKKILGAFK